MSGNATRRRHKIALREQGAPPAAGAMGPPRARWLRPPALHPVDLRSTLLPVALVVFALSVLYALSTPRYVLLEDDGLFLMSSVTFGVSHPPGYPLHTLLGWLAAHLPISTPAMRVHMLSGLLGALSCGVLGWIIVRRTGSLIAGCTAALAYGVSEHFWSQAILAEVYTLNTLFFFAILALCQEAAASPSRRLLAAAATLYGMSLANHWPLMVLATPALVLTVACRWREIFANVHILLGAVLAGAILPYGWMVWRSNQDPLISFYGPLRTWHDVVFYVGRKGYSGVEASATAGWADKFQFAGYVLRETVKALTPVGACLAVAGLIKQWRAGWRAPLSGEVIAFVASGLLLAFLLGFDYDFLRIAVFRPYPLVAYGLLALWLGAGAAWALDGLRIRQPTLVPILGAALLVIPLFLTLTNWPVNNRSRDNFADRHARLLMKLVEPESALLLYGDTDTGPVGYLHVVEGLRPDVSLYNLQGLVFHNRIAPALSSARTRQERLVAFLGQERRSVYHMTDKVIPPRYGEEHLGFLKRIIPAQKAGTPRPVFRPEAAAFFRELMAMPQPVDRWVRTTRNQLLSQYGNFLGLAQISADQPLRDLAGPLVTLASRDYYSLNGMAEMLTAFGPDRPAWERAVKYLDDADRLRDDSLGREHLGREYYLRGFLAFRLGDAEQSRRLFERSIEVFPGSENASRLALQELRQIKRSH